MHRPCGTQSRRLKIYGAGDSTIFIEPDDPPFRREGVPVHESADGARLLAPTRLDLHEIRIPHLVPYVVLSCASVDTGMPLRIVPKLVASHPAIAADSD